MIPIEQFVTGLLKSVGLFIPETVLVITFMLALIFDLLFRKSRNISGVIAILGFAVAGFFLYQQTGVSYKCFANAYVVDPFSNFFKWIILLSGLIVVVFSFFSKELYDDDRPMGEYFTLIIGMAFGMFLLTSSSNLILIYVAIETMSISSYILAGYTREIKRASEASLKYVIYGAVSSGLMIYGISILFGLTGSLNLFDINHFLAKNAVDIAPLLIASILIVAGFGYKISAVPFHFWTPDVYEGAPVTITALLSVASKAAGFAVLIRFLKIGFLDFIPGNNEIWTMVRGVDWTLILMILSVLTMTLGNLVAVWQTNMKRLLAYSSIAHAGYILMAVTVLNNTGVAAVLIYFFFYMLMNLGAFFIVLLIANKIGSEEIDDYNGMGYRAPFLAVCMAVFLVSLTGLPPTAGFIGKLYVFAAVIKAGYLWLAVVGVVNSVVSLYYYAKVFRNMYLKDVESTKEKVNTPFPAIIILLVLAIPTLIFGIYFSPIVNWANASAAIFLGN